MCTAPDELTEVNQHVIMNVVRAGQRMYCKPPEPYPVVQELHQTLARHIQRMLGRVEARTGHVDDALSVKVCANARAHLAAGLGNGLISALAAVNRLAADLQDLLRLAAAP